MCEEEEIIKEESPQLPAAFGFVQPTTVEQLARPEAISQRVEDQVLKERRRREGEEQGGEMRKERTLPSTMCVYLFWFLKPVLTH